MSNRAIRKLHGGKNDLLSLASSLQLSDEDADDTPVIRNVSGKKKKPAANLFDLVRNACIHKLNSFNTNLSAYS